MASEHLATARRSPFWRLGGQRRRVAPTSTPTSASNPTYGIPYVVVPASQPKVPITFTAYGDESDPGPYPVPANAPVEAGGDRHVLVASADCHLYEMYNASRNGRGWWNADSGAVFNLRSDALRPDGWTSADAAGLPILPGLVRADEVASGHINHALRFTVSQVAIGLHPPGDATRPDRRPTPNVPPMGARFRLKASFDTSGFHGAALVILQALKTLRDDRRRQRVELVHLRRHRHRLERRRPQPAQVRSRFSVRGGLDRRHPPLIRRSEDAFGLHAKKPRIAPECRRRRRRRRPPG